MGNIAPKRVDEATGASGGGGPSSPTPVPAAASATQTSAWNTAGTMEQRHMASWVKDKLVGLLGGLAPVEVAGRGTLRFSGEVKGWEEGGSTADILLARGKTKKVYDLHFTVVIDLVASPPPSSPQKVLLKFLDVSNDTAGEARAVKVEFEGGPTEEMKDAIKSALDASLLAAVRGAVEETISAFLTL